MKIVYLSNQLFKKYIMNELPKGAVIMWYGKTVDIPDGWLLCDGENGTPNLKQKFIVGADDDNTDYKFLEEKDAKGVERGKASVTLSEGQMPKHKHSYTRFTRSGYSGTGRDTNHKYVYYDYTDKGISTNEAGKNEPHENRPPYYALYFIMKVI